MRNVMTGASAAALLAASASIAFAQAEGQGEAGARAAQDLTCREIGMVDTALVPGMLYFVAGQRAGTGAAGADGEMAGMEDATAAQEQAVEDEPGPAVAGTEQDPDIDEVVTMEGEADMEEAEVDLPEADDEADADMAEDMPAEGDEAPMDASAGAEEDVALAGFFAIPIEQTVLACAEDPDALVADVIEAQRGEGDATEN